MGFFDSLWQGIKDVASNIYSGVKSAVGYVTDKVQPVVKAVADYASYIPVIGAPIAGVASQINKGIDVARGIVGKVGDIGSAVGKAVDTVASGPRMFRRPMM